MAKTLSPELTLMTGYIYGAGGERVAKCSIAARSCDSATSGFQPTDEYLLGQGDEH